MSLPVYDVNPIPHVKTSKNQTFRLSSQRMPEIYSPWVKHEILFSKKSIITFPMSFVNVLEKTLLLDFFYILVKFNIVVNWDDTFDFINCFHISLSAL